MDFLEILIALFDLIGGAGAPAYAMLIIYVCMGAYLYKMTIQINEIKKSMLEYKTHTNSQIEKVLIELTNISKVVYKMAGKLEIT